MHNLVKREKLCNYLIELLKLDNLVQDILQYVFSSSLVDGQFVVDSQDLPTLSDIVLQVTVCACANINGITTL